MVMLNFLTISLLAMMPVSVSEPIFSPLLVSKSNESAVKLVPRPKSSVLMNSFRYAPRLTCTIMDLLVPATLSSWASVGFLRDTEYPALSSSNPASASSMTNSGVMHMKTATSAAANALEYLMIASPTGYASLTAPVCGPCRGTRSPVVLKMRRRLYKVSSIGYYIQNGHVGQSRLKGPSRSGSLCRET